MDLSRNEPERLTLWAAMRGSVLLEREGRWALVHPLRVGMIVLAWSDDLSDLVDWAESQ